MSGEIDMDLEPFEAGAVFVAIAPFELVILELIVAIKSKG